MGHLQLQRQACRLLRELLHPQIHLTERAAECGVNLLDQDKPREQQLLTRINQIAKDLGIYYGSNHTTKVLGVLALVS